jgi:hypothetical protein
MADLRIDIIILDLDVQKAAKAFLRKHPIPKIDDPDNVGEFIDQYPNTKVWVREWLTERLLRAINKGIALVSEDMTIKLTKEIFGESLE